MQTLQHRRQASQQLFHQQLAKLLLPLAQCCTTYGSHWLRWVLSALAACQAVQTASGAWIALSACSC